MPPTTWIMSARNSQHGCRQQPRRDDFRAACTQLLDDDVPRAQALAAAAAAAAAVPARGRWSEGAQAPGSLPSYPQPRVRAGQRFSPDSGAAEARRGADWRVAAPEQPEQLGPAFLIDAAEQQQQQQHQYHQHQHQHQHQNQNHHRHQNHHQHHHQQLDEYPNYSTPHDTQGHDGLRDHESRKRPRGEASGVQQALGAGSLLAFLGCNSAKLEPPQSTTHFEAEVLELEHFRSEYQRNNKKSGKKHLRCFPMCSPHHVASRACAYPVKVRFARPVWAGSQRLVALARFRCVTEERIKAEDAVDEVTGMHRDFEPGDRVPSARLAGLCRTQENPLLPLFTGKLVETQTCAGAGGWETEQGRFEFQEQAWQYGWRAGRHRRDMQHVLRVYIFESSSATNEETSYTCRAVTSSPKFRIYSSRFRYNSLRAASLRGGATEEAAEAQASDPLAALVQGSAKRQSATKRKTSEDASSGGEEGPAPKRRASDPPEH